MSKSRGNVVAPDEYVARYGADTFRCYLMFIGPWERGRPLPHRRASPASARWLNRVWSLVLSEPRVRPGGRGRGARAAPPHPPDDPQGDGGHRALPLQHAARRADGDDERPAPRPRRRPRRPRRLERGDRDAAADDGAAGAAHRRRAVGAHRPPLQRPPAGLAGLGRRSWPARTRSRWSSRSTARCATASRRRPASTRRGRKELALPASPRVRQFTDGKQLAKVVYVPGKLVNVVVR